MSATKRKREGQQTQKQPTLKVISAAQVSGGEGGGVGEVGRLVDSSQADDRRMIRMVRERPLLYARNNMPVASYYTQVKKLWQEVAEEMGWTVADVRRKWSHIRNSYSRHLRNEMYGMRTGRGRMVSKWYLADELDFLREHMATDMRPSRYSYASMYLEQPPQNGSGVVGGAEAVELKPFLTSPWYSALAHSPPPAPGPPEPLVHLDECASGSGSFDPDENAAYFKFFRGIYNDYQELPAKKQRLFRRECLSFLHRLLDEEDGGSREEMQEQQDAMNLSSSAVDSDDERDNKMCVFEKVTSDGPLQVLPH